MSNSIPAELQERFNAIEPFAQGSTGTLYMAREAQSERQGILKLLHNRVGASDAERQRLKRELAKQATAANPHLALPIVTGEADRVIWLFREWIDGASLRSRIDDGGALAVPEALAIGSQLAGALDELHRAGLLHRDLKPGHVMLQPQPSGLPHVTVIDAGIAARVETGEVFDVVGTPAYVSPEQATGKLISFRSDLYALGCVIYEMLTGKPLFSGDVASVLKAHAEEQPPSLPSALPEPVQTLLGSLLHKEPRERPFSAQQVRRMLDPFVPGGSPANEIPKGTLLGMPAVKPPSPPEPSAPPPPPDLSATPKKGDGTQELDALDLEIVDAPKKSVPPPTPQVSKPPSAPPPAPAAPVNLSQTLAGNAPPPAPGVPSVGIEVPVEDELDYDDLAETQAMDREAAAAKLAYASGAEAAPGSQPEVAANQLDPNQAAPNQAAPGLFGPPSEPAFGQNTGFGQAEAGASAESGSMGNPAPMGDPASLGGAAMGAAGMGAAGMGAAPMSSAPAVAPAQSIAPAAYESGPVEAAEPKKKSVLPMILLIGLLAFCLGTSLAGAAAYYFLNAGEQLALDLGDSPLVTAPSATEPSPQPALPEPAPSSPTEAAAVNQGEPSEATPAPTEAAPTEAAPEEAATEEAATEEAAADTARSDREEARADREQEREERRAEREREREERRTEQAAAMEEAPAEPTGSPFEVLRTQAREHFRARRYAQAAAAYERAAAMNPGHAGSFAGLGASRRALGDTRGAIAAYQRAVTLQPNNSGFHAALAASYEAAGNRAQAIRSYQRALQLDPNNRAALRARERYTGR
ncbi:MAG: protein kinase [Myxococcota bacterium]